MKLKKFIKRTIGDIIVGAIAGALFGTATMLAIQNVYTLLPKKQKNRRNKKSKNWEFPDE